jgi:hypothetical protein
MRGSLSVVSASVILAGSALLVGLPATSASASMVYSQCVTIKAVEIECVYEYTGYGATAAAAEANAATYAPSCGSPELIAGPEISDGQWYVEYENYCRYIL